MHGFSSDMSSHCCLQDMHFYQLPEHAHYYAELVNGLTAGGDAAVAAEHATVCAHNHLTFPSRARVLAITSCNRSVPSRIP